ncbi:hypothetical protein NDU88_007239 [Pleurodeles waltl]|uniref:Uncharacterized protein n=1 Tax=Pleurodeles waltl TaxID=8319 RepID=A0AAV7QN56_PLEWA|nr:hypothetical protein NDU88_007239 [Pleurodeles waltl]
MRLLPGHGSPAVRTGRRRPPSSASVSCLSHPAIEPLRSWFASGCLYEIDYVKPLPRKEHPFCNSIL